MWRFGAIKVQIDTVESRYLLFITNISPDYFDKVNVACDEIKVMSVLAL
jgi:hypothetical protein